MSLVDSDNDGFIDAKEFNAFFNFCAQAFERWKWHSWIYSGSVLKLLGLVLPYSRILSRERHVQTCSKQSSEQSTTKPPLHSTGNTAPLSPFMSGKPPKRKGSGGLGGIGAVLQVDSLRQVQERCTMRIITVNDVYELGNLPFLDGVIR